MKIQPTAPSTYQPLSTKKDSEKGQATEPSSNVNKQEGLANIVSAANQALFIGAKSLMAALNKELKFDGTYSYSTSSSQSLEIKTIQGSIINKVDIEPITFDFEKVANNVMEFVSGVIKGAQSGGASDDKLNEMLAQAREGVDMGFEMAREELGGLDMLTDDVKLGMDKSYDLIQQGLSELSDELFNPQQSQNIQMVAQSMELSEHESASISITTLDGDNVNINFSNDMNLQYGQSSKAGQVINELSLSNNRTFSFSVEGVLDKKELKAVAELVKDISKLADDFFNGNIEKAWQQANELDFEPKQIAQYALDFEEVKQVSIKQNYSFDKSASPIAVLSPYINDLNKVIAQGNEIFSENNLKTMMRDIAQQQLEQVDSMVTMAQQFIDFNQQLLDAQQR
jgi:hypothetical protein